MLAVTEADDDRRLVANADELVRVIVMDDDEREMALEAQVGVADRLDEVARVGVLDQMRDDLGVGLGGESVPGCDQLVAQLP